MSARLLSSVLVIAACGLAQAQPRAQSAPNGPRVESGAFSIDFAERGAGIVGWTIADPAGARAGGPAEHALIDPEVAAAATWPMLSLRLDGDAQPPTYTARRDGDTTVVFTAPQRADGLEVEVRYQVDGDRSTLAMTVTLRNRGTAPIALTPGITVGPGLGYSVGRRPELYEEGRVTDMLPFFFRDGSIYGAGVASEEPFESTYPEEGTGLAGGGLHSQFFFVAVRDAASQPFEQARIGRDPADGVANLIAAEDFENYPSVTLIRPGVTLAAGAEDVAEYTVYAGPKDRAQLLAEDPSLEPVLFHHLWDWLAAVCLALQSILAWLHGLLGSWGLAIVVFAILFRIVTLPLSIYGQRQQLLMKDKMAELKPLVAALKEKHKKNSEARDEAILKLYKQHGVSPFSHFKGCAPLLVQLPVLIALFNLLLTSYDLLGESFLWIDDLTLTDRLLPLGFTLPWLGSYVNLLPIIMLAAQLWTARSMTAGDEGGGGAALFFMPIALTILFYPFPAGCMLFWTTGTLFQLFEQRLVRR